MKKILFLFILITSIMQATIINSKEEDALNDRLRLYRISYKSKSVALRNYVGKREIIITNRLAYIPLTSKVAFGDRKYSAVEWEKTKEEDGITYFCIPGTTKRKAIKKIDGKYVALFYLAVGKNDHMVENTFDDVRKALERN